MRSLGDKLSESLRRAFESGEMMEKRERWDTMWRKGRMGEE